MLCKKSAVESLANTVGGIIIAQLINLSFGIPLVTSLWLTVAYFFASTARAYAIRIAFKKWVR